MKKGFKLFLILMFCLMLVACKEDDSDNKTDGDKDSQDNESIIDGDKDIVDFDKTETSDVVDIVDKTELDENQEQSEKDDTEKELVETENEVTEQENVEIDLDSNDFPIRVPKKDSYQCIEEMSDFWVDDVDIVCQVKNSEMDVELYLQSRGYDCKYGGMFYKTSAAWIKTSSGISFSDAKYDFGGRHHNDTVTFTHNGKKYIIWHSSIGWGWRACTRPDCLVICDNSGTCSAESEVGLAKNGCERKAGEGKPELNAICVQVKPDGTVPPFLDPWTSHIEDSDYPKLPCGGESQYR